MPKAKTLDRLELTRRKFSQTTAKDIAEELHKELIEKVERAKWGAIYDAPKNEPEEHFGLQVCPNCGSKALRLDGGCMSCLSCGWSACHNS